MKIPQDEGQELVEEKIEEVIESKKEEGSNIVADLEKKLKETDDRLKRIAADYQNLLRRSQGELDDARKYSSTKFAKKTIESVDVLKLAIEHTDKNELESNQHLKTLFDGLTLAIKEIEKGCEENNIIKMNVKVGDTFDFNLHNAILMVESDIEKGKICEVLKDGYKIFDRVLMHAVVKVSSGK